MNSLEQLPLWVEVLVALLLVISSVFAPVSYTHLTLPTKA